MTPLEAQLQEELQQAQEELARLRTENQLLRFKLEKLSRRYFGCSSEQLSPGQLELLLELSKENKALVQEPEELQPQPSKVQKPQKPRKPRLPENLPVEEQVIEPLEVQAHPDQWRRIGQEVSDQLDYQPGHFFIRRIIRPTYVSTSDPDRAPVTAPLPEKLRDRSLPAPGLLAHLVVGKYVDHLPLYRQEQIFEQRYQVRLPRQTLCSWVSLVADWLKPIYGHLREEVFKGGYVQLDETPVRYLKPGNGKTKQGFLWTANRPDGPVCYHWDPSRSAASLEKVLPMDFSGTLQCDGYASYGAVQKQRSTGITLAGCWAHGRRKFFEAMESAPRTAGWFLNQIQNLYRIEARLRERGASPKLRQAVRAQESRPIVERIGRACRALLQSTRHLPKSPILQAVQYALGQWANLEIYLSNGQVEIDNNLVYAAHGINQVMPPPDLCRIAA